MNTKTAIILTMMLVSIACFNASLGMASIVATVDINPDTLNVKSNGEHVTAYIELPVGYDVMDIDRSSIRLGRWINSGNLLTNGGFEDGFAGWTQTGSGGGSYYWTVVTNGTHPHAFQYCRVSGASGGSCGAYQPLDILVSDYTELYVELDVKVISNSLTNSGWWSYQYGGYGEWPATIYVTYEDADSNVWIWSHAFFPNDNNEYYGRTNFNYVTRNTWHHYVSPNLVDVTTTRTGPNNQPIPSPTPFKITRIWVGGTGWAFKGRYDNVNLWGIRFTDGILATSCDWPLESVIGDYDNDGVADMLVKFLRADVIALVKAIDMDGDTGDDRQVTLTLLGTVASESFEGSDTVRVIRPGK